MLPTKKSVSEFYNALASDKCEFNTVEKLLKKDEALALQIENPFDKNTALHIAAMNPFCKVDVIRLLLNSGVNVSAKNHKSKTALHLALDHRTCNLDVINELLNRGTNLNDIDVRKCTPLMIAVSNMNCDTRVIKTLIKAGCNVNTNQKWSPLCQLLFNESCSLEAVRLLLDEGAKLEEYSKILIYISKRNCKIEIIQELFCRGDDFMVKDLPTRRNLLHLAVLRSSCFKIVSFLLANVNIDINEGDNQYETPLNLLLGISNFDERVVSLLLKHGADVNIPNIKNQRPLHRAVDILNCDAMIVNMLLDAGATVFELDGYKKSPLRILMKDNVKRNIEYAKLLVRYGVKENFKNYEEWNRRFEEGTVRTFLCPDVEHTAYGKDLSVYVDDCLQELIRTKTFTLRKDFTLFDVIEDIKPIHDEYIIQKIFEIFSSHRLPIYKHCVAESVSRSYLLRKIRDLKICSRSNADSEGVVLFQNCVEKLIFYLNNDDLFNLYLTYCIYS